MDYIKNEITAILLEDDPEDAELVIELLKKTRFKFTFHQASRLEEYQTLLRLTSPNLILADYRLPDMNGHDAMLLAMEANSMIPFIFVTGSIGEQLAADTILNGAWGYVLKNNLEVLPSVIESVVIKYNDLVANDIIPRMIATRARVHNQIVANTFFLNKAHAFINSQEKLMKELNNKGAKENAQGDSPSSGKENEAPPR
ncbi:MAG: response regulator [Bacteroidia bacterium]